jgi:hypothetical protein
MIALVIVNQTSDAIMNSWWRVESITNIKHYFHLLGQILTFFDVSYFSLLFYVCSFSEFWYYHLYIYIYMSNCLIHRTIAANANP